MLNAKSHHPEQIKGAAIVNTITTYEAVCSTVPYSRKWLQERIPYIKNIEKKENNHKEKTQEALLMILEGLSSVQTLTFELSNNRKLP